MHDGAMPGGSRLVAVARLEESTRTALGKVGWTMSHLGLAVLQVSPCDHVTDAGWMLHSCMMTPCTTGQYFGLREHLQVLPAALDHRSQCKKAKASP